MLNWLHDHPTLVAIATLASVAMIAVGVIAAPLLVIRIPADYFAHRRRPPSRLSSLGPLPRLAVATARNLLGAALMLLGAVMLVTPGQGLLTLLAGFLLLDFPGKYRIERWVLATGAVARPVNWLRRRKGREPLAAWRPGEDGPSAKH